jgi:hypothetical protein
MAQVHLWPEIALPENSGGRRVSIGYFFSTAKSTLTTVVAYEHDGDAIMRLKGLVRNGFLLTAISVFSISYSLGQSGSAAGARSSSGQPMPGQTTPGTVSPAPGTVAPAPGTVAPTPGTATPQAGESMPQSGTVPQGSTAPGTDPETTPGSNPNQSNPGQSNPNNGLPNPNQPGQTPPDTTNPGGTAPPSTVPPSGTSPQ